MRGWAPAPCQWRLCSEYKGLRGSGASGAVQGSQARGAPHGLCSLASPLLHPCASLDPGTRWLPDSISCVVHGAASRHGAWLSSQSAAGDPAAHLNPCSSAGSTSLPAAAVLGGSWLPATVPIAVCTHSPCSAKYLTYSPMRWDKEKSQALFVTSQCPRKQRPAYRPESGCGLACSAPSPTIEQLIWGFPEPHWTLPRRGSSLKTLPTAAAIDLAISVLPTGHWPFPTKVTDPPHTFAEGEKQHFASWQGIHMLASNRAGRGAAGLPGSQTQRVQHQPPMSASRRAWQSRHKLAASLIALDHYVFYFDPIKTNPPGLQAASRCGFPAVLQRWPWGDGCPGAGLDEGVLCPFVLMQCWLQHQHLPSLLAAFTAKAVREPGTWHQRDAKDTACRHRV